MDKIKRLFIVLLIFILTAIIGVFSSFCYLCGMNYRERIKEICSYRGLNQRELADRLEISPISLNKTLRGDYPRLQTLEKIAGILDVPMSAFFEQERVLKPGELICPKCGAELEVKIKE